MEPNSAANAIFIFFGLCLRIIGSVYCSNKASSLNRSSGGWGLFGFLSPILAIIWIQFMKPVIVWTKETNNKNPAENQPSADHFEH